MADYNKIEIAILKQLYKHGYIGKRHTPFENALKESLNILEARQKTALKL